MNTTNADPIRAFKYSDKSFAVYGNTQPYKDAFSSLGGKWNRNLKCPDAPEQKCGGWIYSNKSWAAVDALLAQIASGTVAPAAVAPSNTYAVQPPNPFARATAPPAVQGPNPFARVTAPAGAPVIQAPPAVQVPNPFARVVNSPPAAVPSPFAPVTSPSYALPFVAAPTFKTPEQANVLQQQQSAVSNLFAAVPKSPPVVQPVARPASPFGAPPALIAGSTLQAAAPMTVNFPNRFLAANGVQYQIVMYTVPLPQVGQKAQLTDSGNVTDTLTVKSVNAQGDIVKFESVTTEEGESEYEARIINGKWQLMGYLDDFEIAFLGDFE